jgi:hypothetical protein
VVVAMVVLFLHQHSRASRTRMQDVGYSAGIPSSINNTSIIKVSAEETIGGCYSPDDPAVLVDQRDVGAAYGDFEAEGGG